MLLPLFIPESLHSKAAQREVSRILILRIWETVLRSSSDVSEQFCNLWVLSVHIAYESNRYVEACMIVRGFKGSVNDEGVINDAGPKPIKFQSAPGSCSTEIKPDSDEAISFTGLPRDCRADCRFWDFTSIWLFDSPCWLRSNFIKDHVWKAKSCRLSVFCEAW